MGRMRGLIGRLVVKIARVTLPCRLRYDVIRAMIQAEQGSPPRESTRRLRHDVIRTMIQAEQGSPPRESIRWLLQVHDEVDQAIDQQCMQWGNGVHIKHELMDGIHSFFYERIRAGAHVLDVGCGYGAVAYAIATHARAYVVGVDMNEQHITFARNRFPHPNLRFEVGDVTRSLPVERVNVVVLSSVIEHLPTRIELLKTLVHKFDPELFLIRVPTFERHYFAALKRELGLFPYTDPTHLLEYSPDSFAAEMDQAGLDIRYMEIRWGDIWAECVPRRTTIKSGS